MTLTHTKELLILLKKSFAKCLVVPLKVHRTVAIAHFLIRNRLAPLIARFDEMQIDFALEHMQHIEL